MNSIRKLASMGPNILGISAFFHDAAVCIMRRGRLLAAAEEERFTRVKHDPSFPSNAARYCLRQAGLTLADLDCVAYYENPLKKLGRQLWMGLPGLARRGPQLYRLDPNRPRREIRELLGFDGPIHFIDHHQAHAASAYYFSGFSEAAVLTVDGVGEWATTTYGRGNGAELALFEEVQFPDSLGLLYSTITGYLGFAVNRGEYKVMGLAAYGKPAYLREMRCLIQSGEAGQFRLDMRYFDFPRRERMYSDAMTELFGMPPRQAESEVLEFHRDVAKSLQVVLEEILREKVAYLHGRVACENLCLAGGVALNCVANGVLLRNGPFRRLFVQPAANDAGGALGAAAATHVELTGARPENTRLDRVFLGPGYGGEEIRRLLRGMPLAYDDFRGREDVLLEEVAARLARGEVVGLYHGRMEFGPRALGSRSILGDPRHAGMRDRINALVKKRESFRPFAPAVLEERAKEHFDLDHPSPFMLETCKVISKLELPAITHVDGSARVQTVHADHAPRFAALLRAFEARTGCPILLNTSFNMRGEPIVHTPVEALTCFVRAGMDCLILEDFLITREALPSFWPQGLELLQQSHRSPVSHRVYTFF